MVAALTVGKTGAREISEPRDRSDGLLGGGGGFLLSPSTCDTKSRSAEDERRQGSRARLRNRGRGTSKNCSVRG